MGSSLTYRPNHFHHRTQAFLTQRRNQLGGGDN